MDATCASPHPAAAGLARCLLGLLALPGIGRGSVRRMAAGLGGWAALASSSPARLCELATALRRRPFAAADLEQGLAGADQALGRLAALGGQVLVPDGPLWPPGLARLADPPLLLFVRGDAACLARPALAVVGSRTPGAYGLACARRFGQRVAEHGAVVVSGLALGCDGAAHLGALDAAGCTIAVLPCPIDQVVPPQHQALAERIVAGGGALVGEYAPDPAALVEKHHFIERDRLQAGLARGLLVVECGAGDGTLHAVHAAERMGLPIACLRRDQPAWLADPATAGGRELVDSGRATPLAQADDLAAWLAQVR
ncbi:MAG: DNA-protecting protein DprA [Planctomycetes bacterium]|nr:DNA-protecting protein DprA [Planctomycetota bacterium]